MSMFWPNAASEKGNLKDSNLMSVSYSVLTMDKFVSSRGVTQLGNAKQEARAAGR